ncbi:hypothetical protein ACE04B_21730 [Rhizobium phaseoli]
MLVAGLPQAGDLLAGVLSRFNDLRNAVAHADQKRVPREHFRRSLAACARINPDLGAAPSPYDITVSVCAFMGDGAEFTGDARASPGGH